MTIWELKQDSIRPATRTSFQAAGIRERDDLQRLLRAHIDVISPDTLVIAEEFCHWDDSKRRIDLLGLHRPTANLMVIELKRTEDGGHMDLQAIRYASMVSTMSFRRVVEAHEQYLAACGIAEDAETRILEFLGWPEADPDAFAQDVAIVLASAEFSKEVTSTALWLGAHDIDVRCVRVQPYRLDDRILLDVQQILPLPEAAEYQVQVREKTAERVRTRAAGLDRTRFDLRIGDRTYPQLAKRHLFYHIARAAIEGGVSVETLTEILPKGRQRFLCVPGNCSADELIEQIEKEFAAAGRSFEPRRYFLEEEQLIRHGGYTYAFSNQWGAPALDAARTIAERFPELRIEFREARE